MEKFFHSKQELIFWLISAVLAVAILLYLYFSLTFLLAKTNETFGNGLKKEDGIVKFKLNQVKRVSGLPGDR